MPVLIPAAIAGLVAESRKMNLRGSKNSGSAFTFPVRKVGPAPAPKNRLFGPVTFAVLEEPVKYASPGSKKKMLLFIATAMARLVRVVIPPESEFTRAPQCRWEWNCRAGQRRPLGTMVSQPTSTWFESVEK